MNLKLKFYRQLPVRGGRISIPSCVIKDIQIEVERAAKKFKVSKSFVVATALADYFGISEQERYQDVSKRRSVSSLQK